MRSLRIKISLIALATLGVFGCKPNGEFGVGGGTLAPPNTSSLSQISPEHYQCIKQDDSTAKYVFREAPSNFFANWSEAGQLEVMKLMGNLPDEYIEHLYKANANAGFQVLQENLGSGIAGLTMLGYYSQWAKVAPGQVDWALNHELGHALHYYIDEVDGGNTVDGKVNNAYQNERSSSNTGSYAKTGLYEWFAEGFQSFYCSPEAQDFMKQNVPQTYEIFQKALVPARWDSNAAPSDLFKILAYKEATSTTTYTNITNKEYKFLISVPEGVNNIKLCWGGVSECRDDASKQKVYELKETLANGKRIFYNDTATFPLSTKNTISVIGVNSEDKNVSSQFEVNVSGGM